MRGRLGRGFSPRKLMSVPNLRPSGDRPGQHICFSMAAHNAERFSDPERRLEHKRKVVFGHNNRRKGGSISLPNVSFPDEAGEV